MIFLGRPHYGWAPLRAPQCKWQRNPLLLGEDGAQCFQSALPSSPALLMQKRELGKAAAGAAGGASPSPAPKRGRPFGSTAAAAAAAAVAGDAAAPSNLLGPSLQVQSNFAGPPQLRCLCG